MLMGYAEGPTARSAPRRICVPVGNMRMELWVESAIRRQGSCVGLCCGVLPEAVLARLCGGVCAVGTVCFGNSAVSCAVLAGPQFRMQFPLTILLVYVISHRCVTCVLELHATLWSRG